MGPVTRETANYVIAASILFSLSASAVALRIVATLRRRRAFLWHDHLVFISLLSLAGYVVGTATAFTLGYGSPITVMQTLSLSQIETSLKVFLATQIFSAIAVTAFRLAIVMLYMEIFKTHKFHWLAVGTAIVVVLYGIAAVLMTLLICRPLAAAWNPTIQGKCGNVFAEVVFSSTFNTVTDVWVVFLPLPVIWKLQMTRQRKWGVTASFAVGLITAGANLARLVDVNVCPKRAGLPFCPLDTSILLTAEVSGGIIAACVPTLGSLFFSGNKRSPDSKAPGSPATIGSKPLKVTTGARSNMNDSLFSKETDC